MPGLESSVSPFQESAGWGCGYTMSLAERWLNQNNKGVICLPAPTFHCPLLWLALFNAPGLQIYLFVKSLSTAWLSFAARVVY